MLQFMYIKTIAVAVVVVSAISVFIFHDTLHWDYEVQFSLQENIGEGAIELESWKKKGTTIDCEFELNPSLKNVTMDIFHKDKKIYTIFPETTSESTFKFQDSITLNEPEVGDLIIIKINNKHIFSGSLIKD
tara:strand:+ start:995 stop:1390 length:396 start_codon:yes stop_codon:yes gene_type:complete